MRPNEPPDSSTDVPGLLLPLLVITASAPPSVFRPNTGFDPGINWNPAIADCGTRSQFTTSPNASLMRTPSWNTEIPCGTPRSGDAVKPRKLMSGWYGLPCAALTG